MLKLEINIGAAIHNLRVIQGKVGKDINAVVKANCYGHGTDLCKYIEPYVHSFSVSSVSEAKELRQKGVTKPVYILGTLEKSTFEWLPNVVYTVCSGEDIDFFSGLDYSFTVAVKANTGMNRLGVRVWSLKRLIERVKEQPNLCLDSVFTHFYNVENKSYLDQFELFSKAIEGTGVTAHCCASNCLKIPKKYHMDRVRCGLAMYGYGHKELIPVMKAYTTIAQISNVKAGEHVGYGDHVAKRDMTVATLRAGYADGYRRVRKQQYVSVNGVLCPVIGQVSMDMTAVNVTSVRFQQLEKAYFVSELYTAEHLAKANDTIPYEILTAFNGCRVRRFYIE